MTLTLDSVEALRLSLVPDPDRLELSSGGSSDFREAQIMLGLRPRPEPDEGKVLGRDACHWCGRSDPPGGLTTTDYQPVRFERHADPETLAVTTTEHHGPLYRDPSGFHCSDEHGCMEAHRTRESTWINHQFPDWRKRYAKVKQAQAQRQIDWAKTLRARQYAAQLAQQRRFAAPVSSSEWAQMAADSADPEFAAALAAVRLASTPSASFLDSLGVQLAARRAPGEQLELAAEGEGIFGPSYDQPAPPAWALYDDPDWHWRHTMRNPANRAHTLGSQLAARDGPAPAPAPAAPGRDTRHGRAAARRRGRRLPGSVIAALPWKLPVKLPIAWSWSFSPAVVTLGVCEFQHGFARCWRELASGAAIHIVHKRAGLHRAWLVPERPEGCETPVPVTCSMLRDHLGPVFDLVRGGAVFEVRDAQGAQPGGPKAIVRGYLTWCPPEGIARLDAALQFTVRSFGRSRLRDIWPLETEARP